MHDGRPDRSRVVDVGIDIASAQRIKGNGRPQRRRDANCVAGGVLLVSPEDLAEDMLFGKRLCANDDARGTPVGGGGHKRDCRMRVRRPKMVITVTSGAFRRASTAEPRARTRPSSTSASTAAATQPTRTAVRFRVCSPAKM